MTGELRKVPTQSDANQRMLALTAEIVARSPQEFASFIRAQIDKWGKLVLDAATKANKMTRPWLSVRKVNPLQRNSEEAAGEVDCAKVVILRNQFSQV